MSGITREPTAVEVSSHRGLLARNALGVENLEVFVHHIAEGAGWRSDDRPDGEERREDEAFVLELKADLATIILAAQRQAASPQRVHRVFRLLRPFTDGNGRCGRALFVWQTLRRKSPHEPTEGEDKGHPIKTTPPVQRPSAGWQPR
jgi:hypothetical protein